MTKKNLPLCPVSRTAFIIGSRWTSEIIRELVDKGARRFSDFETVLVGIAPNTLSNRLKMLEDHGIIERRIYDTHPPRSEYHLTQKGQTMRPIIDAMRNWGKSSA
ncbi:helix-turn-helix domain-containing protein [Hyphomonas sp. FCG-A18]|uniref:winged helix-turn-helix transcriptional regulator n=1 Tax=Hyphomonas sp. FCG-A18 TaxID=3080019 RepID=UPI002B2A63D0|nr:helix-turn-helix domain-containing protein [Hyphomonas sp. FCG-A18]